MIALGTRLFHAVWDGPRINHSQFVRLGRMGEIDGLRGVAILFVLAGHSGDVIWDRIHGTGVPIFFVNSGFLITLLLLKELSKRGRVDITGFYVRRALRLLPVYFLALFAYTALVLFGLGDNPGNWWERFVLFVTFQNEFATAGTFGHTWTLAMQEKFYFAWPLIGFALVSPLFQRARLWLAAGAVAVLTGAWVVWPHNYTVPFIPLMVGCVVAILMFDRRGFILLSAFARPVVFVVVFVAAVLLKASFGHLPDISVPFSYLVAMLVPMLLVGPAWAGRVVRWRPLAAIGVWAYSIYLLHPIVFSAVNLVFPHGQGSVGLQLVRYGILVTSSCIVGFVSYRLLERPCIELGAKYSRRRAGLRASSTEAASHPGRAAVAAPMEHRRP